MIAYGTGLSGRSRRRGAVALHCNRFSRSADIHGRMEIIMADSKEYIVHEDDRGSINISVDVLATIAAAAALEIEGVAGLSSNIGTEIAELLGAKKNPGKGVKITSEGEEIIADVFVMVRLGYSVNEVASSVQDAVKAAIESMAGFTVCTVNVNICGIALETK